MRAINVLLAFAMSALVALAVIEGGLRLVGKGPVVTIHQPDAEVGWVKRPDFRFRRKTSEFDVLLETNALGLRDDPMTSPAKPAGVTRVLCLGDSFVLGYAVPRDDLFVDVLERWWRAEGRSVDVINAGTEGWSTDQQAAWLAAYGRGFAPDVVLCFPYDNDIWWNGELEYMGTPKPRWTATPDGGRFETEHIVVEERSWLERTAIGRLFQPKPAPPQVEIAGERVLADFAPLFHEPPAGLADAEARTRGALRAMQTTCQSMGAELVLVPLPSHSAVEPAYRKTVFERAALGGLGGAHWSPDRPTDFFLAEARELGIRALDVREPLRDAARDGESLYYQRDFHLNAHGNHVLARTLKSELDGLALLPAASTSAAEPPEAAPAPRPRPRWPFVFAALWLVLGVAYARAYRDERPPIAFAKVGAMLAAIFAIVLGGGAGLALVPPQFAHYVAIAFVLVVLAFVLYKLGARLGTIGELLAAFTLRGHWYLMPLVMILVSVGSLLVVAASSPLVAPFIYTLF